MDVDSLRPGEDWVVAVEGAVTRCDVLLAIIGPDWASAADSDGKLRLHNELDRVRLEIEAALRNSKPVIPVLVEGASMPTSDELPETLKALLRRHAIRVSHATFESDLGALVRALRIIDRAAHGPRPAHKADEHETKTLAVTPSPGPALSSAPPSPAAGPSVGAAPTPSSQAPGSPPSSPPPPGSQPPGSPPASADVPPPAPVPPPTTANMS